MNARDFLKTWDRFRKRSEFISENWGKNKEWVQWIIGSAKASTTHSPLGNELAMPYRSEEWKIDLVTSSHGNATYIDIADGSASTLEHFQPVLYDVLIEHENNIGWCHEEMLKLVCMRARLKVLITYNFDYDTEKAQKALGYSVQQFDGIVNDSNERYPENSDTEYVYIIGRRIDPMEIEWRYFLRAAMGKFEEVSSNSNK